MKQVQWAYKMKGAVIYKIYMLVIKQVLGLNKILFKKNDLSGL